MFSILIPLNHIIYIYICIHIQSYMILVSPLNQIYRSGFRGHHATRSPSPPWPSFWCPAAPPGRPGHGVTPKW